MTAAFAPAPGRAPLTQIIRRQAAMEITLTLRRGESLLLTIVIPVLLLAGAVKLDALRLPSPDRPGFLVPGVLALCVMSTAFTGQAISTGFERSYGVLKRLGASALPRWGLLIAKTVAVLAVLAGQIALVCALGAVLGWRPHLSGLLPSLGLIVLATAALAGANLLYLLMLAAGGVVVPLSAAPAVVRAVLEWLPMTALTDGLRAVLGGDPAPVRVWIVLVVWAVGAVAAAARTFRWE
jgi:ABC-2 type transport system permease protein